MDDKEKLLINLLVKKRKLLELREVVKSKSPNNRLNFNNVDENDTFSPMPPLSNELPSITPPQFSPLTPLINKSKQSVEYNLEDGRNSITSQDGSSLPGSPQSQMILDNDPTSSPIPPMSPGTQELYDTLIEQEFQTENSPSDSIHDSIGENNINFNERPNIIISESTTDCESSDDIQTKSKNIKKKKTYNINAKDDVGIQNEKDGTKEQKAISNKHLEGNKLDECIATTSGAIAIAETTSENASKEVENTNAGGTKNKKKGRSRKERTESKMLRNSGKSYVTEKGKKVKERQLGSLGTCRLKCTERFSEMERKYCFDKYWALGSRDRRAMYISSLITILPKKTQTTASRTLNRDCYCTYKIIINNEDKPICKECFCKTFGETKGFINIVIGKKKDSPDGIIPIDTRGRQPSKNKKTVEDINSAKDHILSFPSYESHYCRKRTNKKYLSSDLSIAAMYRLYKEVCMKPVSLKLYAQCFHDFKLSFKKPAKDTCHTCDSLGMKISLAAGQEKCDLKLELDKHQSMAENAYSQKRRDKEDAKDNSTIRVYTFDLQQCLPTPLLKTSVSFYKRQLWSFNLTIHDLADDKGTCYMWDETLGGRGANQIGSCLWHFLNNLPPDVKQVTFYSDTCGGQNKNNNVAMMFMLLLHQHPTLEVINHKFLISGHTHMECDSDHAIIERTKKKTNLKINHLNDWIQLVRSCKIKKPFAVVPMKLEQFYNFAELSSKKGPFTIKKTDTTGDKFLWKPVKWLQYRKPVGEIYFKTDLNTDSPFKAINYKKRAKSWNLDTTQLNVISKEVLPISEEKKKDLLDLLPLIDPAFHDFYKNIKTNKETENIDPDLDIEEPDLEGYVEEKEE